MDKDPFNVIHVDIDVDGYDPRRFDVQMYNKIYSLSPFEERDTAPLNEDISDLLNEPYGTATDYKCFHQLKEVVENKMNKEKNINYSG